MSTYQGRHGPNVSQYINSLNAFSPGDKGFTENLDIDTDLAMFTNTDFANFDNLNLPDDMNFDMSNEKPEEVKYGELLADADTQSFNGALAQTSPDVTQFYSGSYNTPIQPAPPQSFTMMDGTQLGPSNRVSQSSTDQQSQLESSEETSRVAAEEDKRRRNTAASARFRVKKKQREQALERTVKDANDKASKLEARVNQLEMENKWLKDLITDKQAAQSREEIDVAYQKFKRESEERDEKHPKGTRTA